MRITQNSMNRTQLMGLDNSLGRLQKTQEQLTSGKRLNRASDDPVATVSTMRLRDQQRGIDQLGRNIDDGLTRLRSADDALTRSMTMMQRVRQQVVAAANGVNGPAQLKAYGDEIAQLRKGLIQLANTSYAGAPVFAGTANVANAFDPASGAFLGNDKPVLRKVTEAPSPAGDVEVAISGGAAYGDLLGTELAGGVLDRIANKLAAGQNVGDELGNIDAAMNDIMSSISTIGARSNRLEALQDLNGRELDTATVALSKVEDVDFVKAAMDLSIQSNAYNAALQASAKILQPSLMDFLR